MQLFILLFLSVLLQSTNTPTSKIFVTITGIESADGHIRIGLYDNQDLFLKSAFQSQTAEASRYKTIVTFDSVPSGQYAISLFHDENSNGKLDSNLLRIPKEPYGFSNNSGTTFGPPDFATASFSHQSSKTTLITITLK